MGNYDNVHCSPIIHIRQTQNLGLPRHSASQVTVTGKTVSGPSQQATMAGTPIYAKTSAVEHPVQNLSLPVREQRPSPQPWNQSPKETVNPDRIFAGRGWAENSPIARQASPSDSTNLDAGMSDNTSEGPKSSGHTPLTNLSSSNTSSSSPHEDNNGKTGQDSSHRGSHDFIGFTPEISPAGLFSFNPSSEMQYPITESSNLQHDTGGIGKEHIWQAGSANSIPNGLTSSSPSTDATWSQLIDGVLWDGSPAGINNSVHWTGQHGPAVWGWGLVWSGTRGSWMGMGDG